MTTDPEYIDITFEAYSFRNQGEKSRTIDMGFSRNNHTMVWGELTRSQLKFIRDRIDAYLEDTGSKSHFTYIMACGHRMVSTHRLSWHSRGYCWEHGFQTLADPGIGSDDFLAPYKPPKKRRPKG
jgi:uncharacterized protein YcgI (DUF1989 family)